MRVIGPRTEPNMIQTAMPLLFLSKRKGLLSISFTCIRKPIYFKMKFYSGNELMTYTDLQRNTKRYGPV